MSSLSTISVTCGSQYFTLKLESIHIIESMFTPARKSTQICRVLLTLLFLFQFSELALNAAPAKSSLNESAKGATTKKLSAKSPSTNTVTGPHASTKVGPFKLYANLHYIPGGKNKAQSLDLFIPKSKIHAGPFPLVINVHGGGWGAGSKDNPPCLDELCRNGIAVASVEYRFVKEARFPAQLYDVKAAVRWLKSNATKYGIDAHRFGVIGGSAGGHLAALLGTNNHQPVLEGNLGELNCNSDISCVVDLAGPTNMFSLDLPAKFLPEKGILSKPSIHLYPKWGLAFSLLKDSPAAVPELARLASPVFWISKKSAPFLIFHGMQDTVVPFKQSLELNEVLQQNSVPCNLVLVPGKGHGDLGADLDKRIVSFFKTHLFAAH